jgi:hypothetical protein
VNEFEWLTVTLAVFSVLLLPALAIMVRGAVKWTRTEDKLSVLVEKVTELTTDKDRVHTELLAHIQAGQRSDAEAHRELLEQMRTDRDATDRRLRFIEEFWMVRGRGIHQEGA